MTRRKNRTRSAARPEEIAIGIICVLGFGSYAVLGVVKSFLRLHPVLGPVLGGIVVASLILAAVFVLLATRRRAEPKAAATAAINPDGSQPAGFTPASMRRSPWTAAEIAERVRVIDWYQFEKLNAAILAGEGWTVERKGGAAPDGGVDLIAVKDGVRVLVQCKQWREWKVQEKVVREMLGSMTHFGVTTGAIHTLKGWTQPAAEFAAEHRISLADEHDLARRARASLADEELDRWLLDEVHRCPKCEAEMVLRTGSVTSFWGCSRYPQCRGTLPETTQSPDG